MNDWNTTLKDTIATESNTITLGEWTGFKTFTDPESEYTAAQNAIAIHDHSYRTHLEITGKDRTDWLNNFITNRIKTLNTGDGVYTFSLDLKGRIQFDANILLQADRILLDLDHRHVDHAIKHLEKYIIVEDVTINPPPEDHKRITLIGPKAADALVPLGLTNASAYPLWQNATLDIDGHTITIFRHDLFGSTPAAFDIIAPTAIATTLWNRFLNDENAAPAGYLTMETLRIENAIPAPFTELSDLVTPAETDQLDRAVSFSKGCYLGQEITERMRSRGSVAKKLTLLRIESTTEIQPDNLPTPGNLPTIGTELFASDDADKAAGTITSTCHSPAHNAQIALAYLRTAHTEPGTKLTLPNPASTPASSSTAASPVATTLSATTLPRPQHD